MGKNEFEKESGGEMPYLAQGFLLNHRNGLIMNLNSLQWNTLKAAMDRIIPADDYPSAWEAGGGEFLAAMFGKELRHTLPLYADGLDGLEVEAQARHTTAFHELTPQQQDEILTAISEGRVKAGWQTAPIPFFKMLVHHVNEGFYSDPGNGGNANAISWKMTGFSERQDA